MIYALMASFFWGVMYYANSKIIKTGMTYSQIMIFSLPLWIFMIFFLKKEESLMDINLIDKNKWLIALFLVSSVIGNFLIFQSLKKTDVVIISAIETTYPIFVVMIKFLLERERIEWTQMLGILITIFGVFLVVKKD